MAATPYKVTAWFDEATLPQSLRRDHATKPGVWGLIRVAEGRLRLRFRDAGEELIVTPQRSGLVAPGQVHSAEPLGPVRMQVEFYGEPPEL